MATFRTRKPFTVTVCRVVMAETQAAAHAFGLKWSARAEDAIQASAGVSECHNPEMPVVDMSIQHGAHAG